jgi:hypothetical protein
MAEDALRRREHYLRLTIDTIPDAVGDAEFVEYFPAGDSSAMVPVTSMLRPKFGFQIEGDATQRTSKTL